MDTPAEAEPTLPPVEAVRNPRTFRRGPPHYPLSFLEAVRYYTGTDPDLIWGPFYRRFRAVRRERTNWVGFSLGAIWDGIPAASQTRPGKIVRFLNWAVGADPAPTLTRAPRASTAAATSASPSTGVESWQQVVKTQDDWSPTQIDFSAWYGRLKHPADYDDEFFRSNYQALYDRLCDFGETWFGAGVYLEDWRDNDEDISIWEVPMTEQFIQYARLVAHEDRGYVNWKDILNDPQHRKWLCIGVFAQIIEKRIFEQLLFGAGEVYQQELDRHDSRWLLEEGFTRKEGRRQIVRASLGEGLLPENFWDAVDDLAGQTVLVFQPLFMLMCLGTGRMADRDGAVFWQEVHTMLAMAGYFQVCMAVSPSIFHVLSATPGARFEWEDEAHADQALYDESKAFRRSHEERWRVLAGLSSRGENARVTRLMDALVDPGDAAAYMPFPPSDAEYRVMDHRRRRGGKVMYAVFPKLTRYRAENVGDPSPLDAALPATPRFARARRRMRETTAEGGGEGEGEGMRISMLSRCMVVYYQGLVHAPADRDDGVPLEAHLNEISWARMAGGVLPYLRRSWDGAGNPVVWPHWPLWPEGIDSFWSFWLLYCGLSMALRWAGYVPEPGSASAWPSSVAGYGRILYAAMLYGPVAYSVTDAIVYLFARWYDLGIAEGPYRFWKIQAFKVLVHLTIELLQRLEDQPVQIFGLLVSPMHWADRVFFDTFLPAVLAVAGIFRHQYTADFVSRLFSPTNGTVVGS